MDRCSFHCSDTHPIWLIFLVVAAFLLVLLIIPGIVVTVALGIVLAPLVLPFTWGITPKLQAQEDYAYYIHSSTYFGRSCSFLLCIMYLFCVVGWPYVVVFWLGPWSSTAVAIANFISITVLIAFVCMCCWRGRRQVRKKLEDEDLGVHSSEITVLESSWLWQLYLISIVLDWYQFSALSFSVPDLKFPPSLQDLLETFTSFGLLSIPYLPREVTLFIAFVAANAIMCAIPMFIATLLALKPFKALITNHFNPVSPGEGTYTKFAKIKKAFDWHRWRHTGEILKHRFPFIGGALFRLLDGADVGKWQKEINMGTLVFTSLLIGVVSANLRTMACVEEDDRRMKLFADKNIECWTPAHTLLALAGGLSLTAFLPLGFHAQLVLTPDYGVRTHKWYTMLERPLKLLTVGVAIQCEALQWTRVRLAVTSASAAGIAWASRALWSSNHAGLNKLRQLIWWSATISSTSSWLHYEIGDPASYAGFAYFTVAHVLLAVVAFSDTEGELLFTRTVPMQRIRRFTRLLILLVTVVFATTAGVLPQLLAVNTGDLLEVDLKVSNFHSVTTDSCAVYVRTVNCSDCNMPPAGSPNSFQQGIIGGRLKIWGRGRLEGQNSSTTVIRGTDLEACELWMLIPTDAVFSIECNGECTLHANGVFDGSLVVTLSR